MTNETDLRDRIRRVLRRHKPSSPKGGTASAAWCDCSCGHRETVPGGARDTAETRVEDHQAQAIIDALGLTVKRVQIAGDRVSGDGRVMTPGTLEPIITGRWEKQ